MLKLARGFVAVVCLVLIVAPVSARAEGVPASASLVAKELIAGAKKALGTTPSTVMVAPFRAPTGDSAAAEFMAALTRAILNEQGVKVVDRDSLAAALKEASVGEGASDGVLADVAGAFGAQAMISGSIDKSGESYVVNARVVLVTTGAIVTSAKVSFAPAGGEVSIEARTLEAQLRRLADKVAKGLDGLDGDIRYQEIAVLPFEEVGATTKDKQLGLLVAAELTTNLRRDHGILLVERSQIAKVVDELALGQTGLTDPSKTLEVGKLAGAQALVIGSVAEAGDRYSVNARVIAVSDGQVKSAEQVDLPAADLVSLSSDAVVLRSMSGAIYRSLLLPGWGQFYNRQPVKGAVFVGAEVLTAGLALTYHLLGQSYLAKYDKMVGPGDSQLEMDAMWDKQVGAFNKRNYLLIGLVVIHAANVLDALISGKSFESATPGAGSAMGSYR